MGGKAVGLALEIDKTGKITRVLFNDLDPSICENKLFPTILHSAEFSAALNFLQRLRTEKLLFEVPLSLDQKGSAKSFYFTGVEKGDYYVVMASNNQGMDANVYDEIAMINNELANQLREALKDTVGKSSPSEIQLEEFTKINNELVNTQRELNKKNKELAELNERKNELIGVAAHDLRNPLGVISGYIQFVMGTSTNLNDAQKQMLDKAIETAQKMTGMLEELLDMSEIESGKVTLNLNQCDLEQLLKSDIELNQVIADRKNIKIHFESSGKTLIEIDEPKIEQVVNNFISNAIKYSHQETNIHVSLHANQDAVRVTVRDEGQGIPKDELPKVFAPFVTTSVKSTGGEKSTGLGLAITKKVIEAHGGTIGVGSEVGIGTEFYFTLPTVSR